MVVLGIPVLNRPDLFEACIRSIDAPLKLVVIDNSPEGFAEEIAYGAAPDGVEVFVTEPPANLGFSASLNLVIRTHPGEPYWLFANADTQFAPGDIGRVVEALETQEQARIVDWRLFGMTRSCIAKVGLWDENFHPVYCEDSDWEYRSKLADSPILTLPGQTSHVGSVCYRGDTRYERHNARTYPENLRYYVAKWGGPLRGGERYRTPFDRGGSVRDWTLEIDRLAAQAWT